MSTIQTGFVTIACDGPNCDKSVTFKATAEEKAIAEAQNPWLNTTHRVVATIDHRQLDFCSDTCEAESIATGGHNKLEPKKIILGNAQQAELAAQAAANAARTQAALKAGAPISIAQS